MRLFSARQIVTDTMQANLWRIGPVAQVYRVTLYVRVYRFTTVAEVLYLHNGDDLLGV